MRPVRKVYQLILFLAGCCLANAANAQEQVCTQIGCENGVIFNLDHDKQWRAGNYMVYVTMDRKTYACKGELPLKPCGEGASFVCSAPDVSIGESGCALPKEQHGLSRIKLDGTPQKVIVRMTYEGKPMVTKTLYPTYDTTQPNGPQCEPVCKSATYRLLLAP